MALRLTVATPAKMLCDVEEITWVHVRLADGTGLTIYPGHAALLAETIDSPIRYSDEDGEHVFTVEAGILEVDGETVTVFTKGESEVKEGRPTPVPAQERKFERLARELRDTLREDQESALPRILGLGDEQA